MKKAYKILKGKSQGRRQYGRPMHWWEDNIREIGTKVWTPLHKLMTGSSGRLEWKQCIKAGNFLTRWTINYSRNQWGKFPSTWLQSQTRFSKYYTHCL